MSDMEGETVASRSRQMAINAKFRLWLSTESNGGAFGDGKCRLLKAIDEAGSLSAAAQDLGMSYRKAWGDLRKAEAALGVELVQRRRGGKQGGEMTLTDTGRLWIEAYESLRRDAEAAVNSACDKYFSKLMKEKK